MPPSGRDGASRSRAPHSHIEVWSWGGARRRAVYLCLRLLLGLCLQLRMSLRLLLPDPARFYTSSLLPDSDQVEVDVLSVPGLDLLTEPAPVLLWDLQGSDSPLPISGSGEALVKVCAPTPVQLFAQRGHCCDIGDGGGGGASSSSGRAASPSPVDRLVADCIVSWFEAELGEGDWISTGPGSDAAGGSMMMTTGHRMQSVHFMQDPLDMSTDYDSNGGETVGKTGGRGRRDFCWIEADYVFDRVMLKGRINHR